MNADLSILTFLVAVCNFKMQAERMATDCGGEKTVERGQPVVFCRDGVAVVSGVVVIKRNF